VMSVCTLLMTFNFIVCPCVSFLYLTLIRIMFDSNSLMLASMPCGVFIPHIELVVLDHYHSKSNLLDKFWC
jgi:hypothetical protein